MVIKDPTKRLNSREFSSNLQFVIYVTLCFEDVEILRFHYLNGTFLLRYKLSPLSRFEIEVEYPIDHWSFYTAFACFRLAVGDAHGFDVM